MKNFLFKTPGFRTKKVWKMVVAVLGYLFMLVVIPALLFPLDHGLSNKDIDRNIEHYKGIIYILVFILIPYILITDIGGIRSKLKIFNKGNLSKRISVFILTFLILIGTGIISSAQLDSLHSEEYKENYELMKKREAAAKAEKEKKEREAAARAEEEKKRVEAAALAMKQQEEKKKAEEEALLVAKRQEEKKKAEEAALLATKRQEEKKKAEEAALLATKQQEEKKKTEEQTKILKESNRNYVQGKQYIQNGNLNEGVNLLKKVVVSDSNYKNAQVEIMKAQKEIEKFTFMSQSTRYEYRELKKNADKFRGEKAELIGKIIHIQEFTNKTLIILSNTDKGHDVWVDDVLVLFDNSMDIYEGDVISVYGNVFGKYSTKEQQVLNWLGLNELKFRYNKSTNLDLMPVIEGKYIIKEDY